VRADNSERARARARTPRIMLTAVSKTCASPIPRWKLLSWPSRRGGIVMSRLTDIFSRHVVSAE